MVPKRKLRRTDRETHWYCLIECLIRHRQMTGSFHLFCEFSFHVSFFPLMQLVVQLLQLSSFSFFNSVKPELPSRVSRLRSEILKHTKHFTEGVQRNSISSNSNVQFFTAINSVSIPQLFFFLISLLKSSVPVKVKKEKKNGRCLCQGRLQKRGPAERNNWGSFFFFAFREERSGKKCTHISKILGGNRTYATHVTRLVEKNKGGKKKAGCSSLPFPHNKQGNLLLPSSHTTLSKSKKKKKTWLYQQWL